MCLYPTSRNGQVRGRLVGSVRQPRYTTTHASVTPTTTGGIPSLCRAVVLSTGWPPARRALSYRQRPLWAGPCRTKIINLAEAVDSDLPSERLKTLARDVFKFRLDVEVVPAEALPPGCPPLLDGP